MCYIRSMEIKDADYLGQLYKVTESMSSCCGVDLELYMEQRYREMDACYIYSWKWRCSKCKRFHSRPCIVAA